MRLQALRRTTAITGAPCILDLFNHIGLLTLHGDAQVLPFLYGLIHRASSLMLPGVYSGDADFVCQEGS